MSRSRRNPARSAAAGVLVLVVALLVPTALVARWVHDSAADTDGYVEVATEVAADPTVQAALVDLLTTDIVAQVPATGLAGVDTRVHDVVEEALGLAVRSETFATVWAQANRVAHATVLDLVTGSSTQAHLDADGQVVLDLSEVADTVNGRLAASGLVHADQVPTFEVTVPFFDRDALDSSRTAYTVVTAVSTWAPWAAVLVLVLALALAGSRGLTLLWAGIASAATTGLALAGVAVVAERATLELTSPSVPPALVGSVADVFAASAQGALRTGLVVGGALAALGIVVLVVERVVRRS